MSSPTDASRLLWSDVLSQAGQETQAAIDASIDYARSMESARELAPEILQELGRSLLRARQVAVTCRQIARLAEGSFRPLAERNQLAGLTHRVIADRAKEAKAREISISRQLPATEVIADTRLLLILLHAVLGWALEQAQEEIELLLERRQRQEDGRLLCRFRHARTQSLSRFAGPATSGVSWQLVRYAAQALGWAIRTGEGGPITWLSLDFPCAGPDALPDVEAIELE